MTLTIDSTKSDQMDALLDAHAMNLEVTYFCRTAGDNTFLGFAAAFLWDMKSIVDADFSQVPMELIQRHADKMENTYEARTAGDNTWVGLLFMFAHDVLNDLDTTLRVTIAPADVASLPKA